MILVHQAFCAEMRLWSYLLNKTYIRLRPIHYSVNKKPSFSLLFLKRKFYALVFIHSFFSCSRFQSSSLCTIMKLPKPSVPRHLHGTIITFKISMRKLMEKITHASALLISYIQLFKPRMAEYRMNRLHISMKH